MKFPTSELAYIFGKGEMRRDILALLRYAAFLVVVILLYAALFQVIMVQVEGQSHSWITAVYWTVVTMSTLGRCGSCTRVAQAGRAPAGMGRGRLGLRHRGSLRCNRATP